MEQMSKTVLLFPGQASQYVGMGKDLYDSSADVRKLYDLASSEIGEDIAKLSFEGPTEELKRTRFTQPAILLHSLAVLTVMKERTPAFDFAAGHSLGEYGALAAASALSFEDAVRAVVKRAALMEEACLKNPGTMAAIIGLNESQVNAVCSQASSAGVVIPANYNSENQIVISGSLEGVAKGIELAKEAGAKRALPLEVGGAFHSPLMATASRPLEQFLENMNFNDTNCPVIANVTAQPVTKADEIKKLLMEQITAPVKWAQTMAFLADQQIQTVIEIGPGKVLSGLAKRSVSPEKLISLDTIVDIENYMAVSVQ